MFKSIHWAYYLKFGALAAAAYMIPLFIFIKLAVFRDGWLLYIGNFAFMIVVASFLLRFNKNKKENAGVVSMFLAGHITTVLGMIMAVFLSMLAMLLLIPGLLQCHIPNTLLIGTPANTVQDKTNGMLAIILLNVTVCNFCTGAFISLIFPFTLKEDQMGENTPPGQSEF